MPERSETPVTVAAVCAPLPTPEFPDLPTRSMLNRTHDSRGCIIGRFHGSAEV